MQKFCILLKGHCHRRACARTSGRNLKSSAEIFNFKMASTSGGGHGGNSEKLGRKRQFREEIKLRQGWKIFHMRIFRNKIIGCVENEDRRPCVLKRRPTGLISVAQKLKVISSQRDKLDSYFTRVKLCNAIKFQQYRNIRFSDDFSIFVVTNILFSKCI